jgi:hypothetical protein
MSYNFPHWFLTSIYAVSRYTVHTSYELTAYVEVYLYLFTPSFNSPEANHKISKNKNGNKQTDKQKVETRELVTFRKQSILNM